MFWSIHMFYSYCLLNTEQKVFLFYIFRELVSQYDILHNWLAFCLSYSCKLCRLNNCWTKIMINNCTNWFMLQNTENKINSDVSIYHFMILINDKKWNNYLCFKKLFDISIITFKILRKLTFFLRWIHFKFQCFGLLINKSWTKAVPSSIITSRIE